MARHRHTGCNRRAAHLRRRNVRSRSSLILTVAFVVVAWQPMAAQATTESKTKPLFTWRDAVLVGGLTIMTAVVSPLDVAIANRLRDSTVQTNRFLGRVA